VETGCRRRGRSFLARVDGLIAFAVVEPLLDVGRRGHQADPPNFRQRIRHPVQADRRGLIIPCFDGDDQRRAIDLHARAGLEASSGANQRLPAVTIPVEGTEQQDLGRSPVRAAPDEPRRQHAAVVEHHQVAGLEVPRQLRNG